MNYSSLYYKHGYAGRKGEGGGLANLPQFTKNILYKTMMKRFTLIYMISREIREINKVIDKKITKGLSYDREARRHKDLVAKLRRVESQAAFARTLAFLF